MKLYTCGAIIKLLVILYKEVSIMKKIRSFIAMISLAISCIGMSGCEIFDILESESSSKRNDNGLIQAPLSSSRCNNKNYKTIIDEFKKAGFKNFKINFEGDLIIGFLASDGEIDSIRINENTSFDKNSSFDTKSVVFMDVHSWDEGLDYLTEPVDGQLPILHLANSLDGFDKMLVGEEFEYIGFTNVTYNPIQDCSSANSPKYNDTEGFTISGSSNFNEYSFFDVDSDIKISYHTIEGDYCINGLAHTGVDSPAIEPTCTEPGWTAETRCSVCNKYISGHTEIPPKGHVKIVDIEACEATCIAGGHTEESHCSNCGMLLSKSEPTPINTNNHTHLEITEAIDATCVSEGRTEGAYCTDCNTTVSVSEIIPINPTNHAHTHVIAGTPATCILNGISDGLFCDDCNTTVVEQHETSIDPNNHTNVIIDPAVTATETTNGKTQGKHCGDCGAIIVKQETTYWYPSLEWMCSHNPTAGQVRSYVNHNLNKTITFNGFIYHSENYNGYSTIFNYYISGGNYVSSSQHNAIFYFEGLSQANRLIKDILGKGKGTKVAVTCKVLSVFNSTFVKCDLMSITCR